MFSDFACKITKIILIDNVLFAIISYLCSAKILKYQNYADEKRF